MSFPNSVVCLGEAILDRLGSPAAEPTFDQHFDDCLGGAPANVACCLARLGSSVTFYGRLGYDLTGNSFSNLFFQRGVDTSLLQWDRKRPTRIVLVHRTPQGERQFHGFAGANELGFADQALMPSPLPQARWLMTGTLPLSSPVSASALMTAVRDALSQGMSIALDLNWRPTFWDVNASPDSGPSATTKALIHTLIIHASLIKLAREEAFWFFNTDDPVVIQQSLPQCPDVVVTDGPGPIRWKLGSDSGLDSSFSPPMIVDTTGAGDAFMAGLLHRCDASPSERIRFAAACGALVCAGAGAIDPQPTLSQLKDFLSAVS